jgi:long-chain acyl-CoA synthetase
VPLGTTGQNEPNRRIQLGEVEWVIEADAAKPRPTSQHASHEIIRRLGDLRRPGLMLFSSGSSGPPKAAVHDLLPLLEKFRLERPVYRTAGFLLFDHIGGLNTLWHVLSNGGLFVVLPDRSAETVASQIERHQIELLPTSPTFLNLLLLSGAIERYDLSSLKVITYGTEPMPLSTLKRLGSAIPNAELRQTYGLSELGILRAKSEAPDSLWVKLGGAGYELDVRDGILWIRAESAMLGYLNAPSPFDDQGWFNTGDLVEVRDDYFRILGRRSELINVGGEKVYPGEVESVILDLPEVAEVVVRGEPNALLGHVVVALVRPSSEIPPEQLRRRVRDLCRERLARFKVPAKITVVDTPLHSDRFKRVASPRT